MKLSGHYFLGYIFLLILAVILVGCSDNNDESVTNQVPEIINAQIEAPEHVDLNENINLKVHLSQGVENVEDADEVKFEIWKNQERELGILIEGIHQQDGIYEVQHTFKEDGVYIVQTHVTARDIHVMPKKMIVAGEVSEEELEAFHESRGSSNDLKESLHHH